MEKIIKALNSPEESERLYAIQDIIALKDTPNKNKTDGYANEADVYAETLVRHLESETSQAVRDSIVYALKLMPCTKALTLLFELFQNSDAYLRNAAVTIFGTKGVNGVAFLTSKLDHADREVRKLVIDSLFQIGSKEDEFQLGSKEAVLAIRAGLNDPSINVRITAVEYLGQLNDTQSVEDILDMLKSEKDQMLITAALETVLQIGDETNIQDTIKFLSNNTLTGLNQINLSSSSNNINLSQNEINTPVDILKVHPVFLPEFIKLIAKCGSVDNLIGIIEFLHSKQTYSKDIVSAIEEIKNRYNSIVFEPIINDFLVNTIKSKDGDESSRYAAAELLLAEEEHIKNHDSSDKNIYLEIGKTLVKEQSMISEGLRFLAKSDTSEGRTIIGDIKRKTKDENIVLLCDELGLLS
ncbi:MAG: HEAT repeat domain-containing protein [Desulfamplus sp.]|nr:HEAT repeat domain-containing protein [Desulfamplus sp.]